MSHSDDLITLLVSIMYYYIILVPTPHATNCTSPQYNSMPYNHVLLSIVAGFGDFWNNKASPDPNQDDEGGFNFGNLFGKSNSEDDDEPQGEK